MKKTRLARILRAALAAAIALLPAAAAMADVRAVQPTELISTLEDGLSVVCFQGDDAFDEFLAQGGARSDADVAAFLMKRLATAGLSLRSQTFGCSTFSVASSDGGRLFGRNFDWNRCDAMIVQSKPNNGFASISTVNLGFLSAAGGLTDSLSDQQLAQLCLYAPLDGMNDQGLCVAVLMISDNAAIRQQTDKPDLTTTTAVRLMLNKAATVDEALALLQGFDLHASMGLMVHFALSDATGRSVAVEYVSNKQSVLETPVLTNFYLTQGEKYGVGTAQSHERFSLLTETLAARPSMTAEEARDALESVGKAHFGGFESTEWSIVYDQTAGTACYYHRENYASGWLFSVK